MNKLSKNLPADKGLHKRSKHNQAYNFDNLSKVNPKLVNFIVKNKYGCIYEIK